MSIQIRAMTPADSAAGLALTRQLGWPHRLEDWQQLIALGEGVVAEEQGQHLGGALGWRWGEHAATIGLVIVAESARGRGVGQQLMRALLAAFPGCRVLLHATPLGRPVYEKLGFRVCGRVWQHQVRALPAAPPVEVPAGLQLRAATPQDSAVLNALDYRASGMQRDRLLQTLLSETVVLTDRTGTVTGFASVRRFGHGYTIGPLVAADRAAAQALMAHRMQRLQGQFVRIDTPDAALAAWAQQQGLPQVDDPVVMVHGTPWQAAAGDARTWLLVSPALG